MRTYSIIAVALLLAGILAGWVILNLRAKARYHKARQAIGPPFLLGTLDSRDEALLAEAKEHWKCMYDAKSESAKVLVIAGYEPTVAGLTAAANIPAAAVFVDLIGPEQQGHQSCNGSDTLIPDIDRPHSSRRGRQAHSVDYPYGSSDSRV